VSLTATVGQTLAFGLKTYTAAGVLADVGTGPTAVVTLPDATTPSATVTKDSTGTYTATIAASLAGRYRITWSGSGANSGGLPYVDVADVWPADPRFIISLAEARAALNVPSTTVVNDDELRGYLMAGTIVIEYLIGAVLPASRVETRSGGGRAALPLAEHPNAITSVVENGVTLPATGYCFDDAGLLWRGSRPGSAQWSDTAPRNVVITYTVGDAVVPANVVKAAANLIRHWWDSGLQQSYYVAGEPDMATTTSIAGYAVPNFVVDLLKPNMSNRVPGFA
jgi:hypothetical protein